MLGSRRRKGVLGRIESRWAGAVSPLDAQARQALSERVAVVDHLARQLRAEAPAWLEDLAHSVGLDGQPLLLDSHAEPRLRDGAPDEDPEQEPAPAAWHEPALLLAERSSAVARAMGSLEKLFDEVQLDPRQVQPILELRRARLRLAGQAASARAALEQHQDFCRWAAPDGRHSRAVLCRAPVDVGPFLTRALYESSRGLVLTSATLAVRNSFSFLLARLGLDAWAAGPDAPALEQRRWASPFDFGQQVLLCLPRDLPPPDQPGHLDAAAELLVRSLEITRGGAFVLCTSHRQVDALADRIDAALGHELAVLRQREASRTRLLQRFRDDPDSVLVGTDSFWEGVNIKGDALRLVAIPRLPFGVPSEPITRARHARMRAQGLDPFRVDSLPRAVLRLRQGFGRLIRASSDRGAVLLLDRRLHDRWYGRQFLAALPPATRAVGPRRVVLARLERFFHGDPKGSP